MKIDPEGSGKLAVSLGFQPKKKQMGHHVTRKKHSLTAIVALMLAFNLALDGCAGSDIPDAKPTTGRNPLVAEVPSASETVRGEDDPPIVTLDLGSALHEHRLSAGDDLPGNIMIPTTNLSAVPITAALQAVLSGTDVSLSWDTGALGDRLVTVMNLSGPLPRVVDKICGAAKVFCTYRHGLLELQDKDTFIVGLPPVAKSTGATASATSNSMVEALNELIGSKVQVDEQGGNILYTTDVEGENRVQKYLEQLRNGRPLVVLQLYVWEVTLNKNNAEGINWSSINVGEFGPGFAKLALKSTSAVTAVAGGAGSVSLGAVTSGHLNTSSLLGFLSTQGRVQTISSPQITFVSGSNAELKVGGTQRYISQVGQLVASNNASGTTGNNTTNGVGSNTVNTDSIDTGLTVSVSGSYENGVIFANMDIALKNLVSLNPTSSGGGTIDLPQTSDEKINTIIRVRPGDNLVLAGIVTSSDENQRQGLPIGDGRLPMYGSDTMQNHELVVVVKPSVVLFSDKIATEEAKQKEMAKPLPDAIFIDKDGSKPLIVPTAQTVTSPALPPQASIAKPELMTPVTNPTPLGNVPLAPGSDNAPVDRRLMQRGFSHAFDDLLQPAPTGVTATNGGTNP